MLGYETGAQVGVMQQMVLQLDRRLEALMGDLAKGGGENGIQPRTGRAHGAPPLPAPESRARMAVNGESVAQAVAGALAANSFGAVRKYVYPFLYLDASGGATRSRFGWPRRAPRSTTPRWPITTPPAAPAPPRMNGCAASTTASTPSVRAT